VAHRCSLLRESSSLQYLRCTERIGNEDRSDRSLTDLRLILTWEELSRSRSVTYWCEAIIIDCFLRFVPLFSSIRFIFSRWTLNLWCFCVKTRNEILVLRNDLKEKRCTSLIWVLCCERMHKIEKRAWENE